VIAIPEPVPTIIRRAPPDAVRDPKLEANHADPFGRF
jgi:hypothetical protein